MHVYCIVTHLLGRMGKWKNNAIVWGKKIDCDKTSTMFSICICSKPLSSKKKKKKLLVRMVIKGNGVC